MPDTDLDTELSRLRDVVRDSLPVPGFEQVVARHRQRVIRRRMQVGAVAAVLVVSAAIPVLRTGMAPDEPAPPAAPPPAELYPQPLGPHLYDVKFADADHGYAIRATCRRGPAACTSELLATDDGEHWDKRELPRPDAAPSWARGLINVLGPEEVTVDWPLSASTQSTRLQRLHSVDGGRTWRTVTTSDLVTDTVAAIPDDGVLIESCGKAVSGGKQCAERSFAVLQPGSGKSAKLANMPPLAAPLAGNVPTRDGVWWAAGRDPETDHWGLAVSDDGGRTWTTTVLDWGQPVNARGWSIDSRGGTLYAAAVGALPSISNGLLGIFRSTDGGHSWEQTWVPDDGKEPRRVFGGIVAGADGALTINTTEDTQYRSEDEGRTFTQVRDPRYAGYVSRSPAGYVAGSPDAPTAIATSEDGVHWRTSKVG